MTFNGDVCSSDTRLLDNAAPVWDPDNKNDFKRIERVQRWVARWVLGDYGHDRETSIAYP